MKITNILINHMTEPLGFDLSGLHIEFELQTDQNIDVQKKLEILNNNEIVYQTDWENYTNNYFDPNINLKPRTKYDVKIFVRNKSQDLSATGSSYFETGKMSEPFIAKWIGNNDSNIQNTLLKDSIQIKKAIKKARIYMSGLGVYELYLNDKKVGNEYLAPGSTAYDKLIQIQTYNIDKDLKLGQNNLQISLGDGLYKGNFGFDGGKENIYGDQQRAILELHITYIDDTEDIIKTDDNWLTTSGSITKSAIYYGEDLDDTITPEDWKKAVILDYSTDILEDRLSLPLIIHEYLPAKELIETPNNEQVIDFKQNHAGLIEFYNREPKGTKIILQMGEVLQNGNFYRKNLREARASFTYISDGENKWISPHFTYFGYRYVKITGNTQPIELKDFRSAVIYSDMQSTGNITTNNDKVNRLFSNIIWGQKSNFFDIPTDCPQRDERLGWTGDAEIFSNTASFNMNVYAFFKKYAKDMAIEQSQNNGMLTMYAPAMGDTAGGAAIWGDAATIIPWNMYEKFNDATIIKQNYSNMKAWVDWIYQNTHADNKFLWTGTFQFGDWLSLDGEDPNMPTGKTDEDFIASIYYYYSSWIVSKSAEILGKPVDQEYYSDLSNQIKDNIYSEYITKKGRVAIDTQTAYALTLYFKIIPNDLRSRVVNDLINRLKKDNNHLQTGFVGTPFLCQALSDNGQHELATKIFLNEDYPSWLYAVNLGATTVWERWNSILPDGSMNPEGMNSLNHYSLGAIMEWAYKFVLGINKQEKGYQIVTLAPKFDYRLKQISGYYTSSYGKLNISYKLETNKQHLIKLQIDIPYGQKLNLVLPSIGSNGITVDGHKKSGADLQLTCGSHEIEYIPVQNYIGKYSPDSLISDVTADTNLFKEIQNVTSALNLFEDKENIKKFGGMSITEANKVLPFIQISESDINKINDILNNTALLSEREA